METQVQKPVLITLTAPTCGGKSYLMSYIRDVKNLPCIVSTTTRPMREGEVEGKDYYYISEEESRAIEERDGFAELMYFRGYRYGVTKEEFKNKLESGIAFLIVEPKGIFNYVQPAVDIGALWLKFFVDTKLETRVKRFEKRYFLDLEKTVSRDEAIAVSKNYFNRTMSLLGDEVNWINLVQWDQILDGEATPEENLRIIEEKVKLLRT